MKARTLLELGRVSNLPTVWSNLLAGAALSGESVRALPVLLAGLAGSAFYVGGMFLNDAFDADIDAAERPERPIPSGRAARGAVFAIGFGLLGAGLLVLAIGALLGLVRSGLGVMVAGALTASCVVIYDRWHKGLASSPLVMGLCRAGLYFLGAFSVAERAAPEVALSAAALALYVIGLTHVARFETSSRVARVWPVAFVMAPLLYAALRGGMHGSVLAHTGGVVLWVAAAAWSFHAVRLALRGGRSIGRAVVSLIAGIALVDAVQIAAAGAPIVALAAVLAFLLTLLGQRYVRGT